MSAKNKHNFVCPKTILHNHSHAHVCLTFIFNLNLNCTYEPWLLVSLGSGTACHTVAALIITSCPTFSF